MEAKEHREIFDLGSQRRPTDRVSRPSKERMALPKRQPRDLQRVWRKRGPRLLGVLDHPRQVDQEDESPRQGKRPKAPEKGAFGRSKEPEKRREKSRKDHGRSCDLDAQGRAKGDPRKKEVAPAVFGRVVEPEEVEPEDARDKASMEGVLDISRAKSPPYRRDRRKIDQEKRREARCQADTDGEGQKEKEQGEELDDIQGVEKKIRVERQEHPGLKDLVSGKVVFVHRPRPSDIRQEEAAALQEKRSFDAVIGEGVPPDRRKQKHTNGRYKKKDTWHKKPSHRRKDGAKARPKFDEIRPKKPTCGFRRSPQEGGDHQSSYTHQGPRQSKTSHQEEPCPQGQGRSVGQSDPRS